VVKGVVNRAGMLDSDVRIAILADVGLGTDALAASLTARPPFVLSGCMLPTEGDLAIRLSTARPDIVIVDADADAGELDLVRTICDVFRAVPRTGVVVIGDQPDVSTAVAAVREGAAAWCDRTTSVQRLVDVMLGVHHGEASFPPRLLRQVLRALTAPAHGPRGDDPVDDAGRPTAVCSKPVTLTAT
jgi:two-component system, NarL family, response regulator LiaR